MADFFQDVFNKTKKFANNAVDETKDAAQKAKLNNEIQMIDRNMVEIGKYFYEQAKGNPPQELMQYFNNIRVLKDSIEISRSEIQSIDEAMTARKNSNNQY